VETKKALYTVQQTVASVASKHGYFVPFAGKGFTIDGIGKDDSALGARVKELMVAYHKHLVEAFSQNSLEADEDNVPAPPGEFHFRRDFKPSIVLKGFAGPYNELSYYVVRWWRAGDSELYSISQLNKGGYGAPGDSIYVQVSHSLTIGVGASKVFAEPDDQQVARYHEAIGAAMRSALARTAEEFKGKPTGTGFTIRLKQERP
jgi:hypothetical protein